MNGCLGRSGLFLKKCLILRDLENQNQTVGFYAWCSGVGMKPSPLVQKFGLEGGCVS